MPASYKIDKEHRLVLSSASGVLTAGDILGHQRRILSDPDFDPNFAQIADFTGISGLDIRAEEVRAIAANKIFSPNARRALLVATDEQFGLCRMFGTIREAEGDHGIRVFRDRAEALRWVSHEERASSEPAV